MEQDFSGKVALVTGGASGIGRAACLQFAARGAAVLVADLDGAGAAALTGEIVAAGGRAEAWEVDVADDTAVAAMVQAALERLGGLDCAFNNAGVAPGFSAFPDVTPDDWSRVIAVNLTGVFQCLRHELPAMAARGGGAIVNTSSGAGVVPAPGQPHYTASKHGVLGLTKVAAQEYAPQGVRVNAILPGTTDTPMLRGYLDENPGVEKIILRTMPMGRLATAEEVAAAAVWLCSEQASFVSGESMLVDGAQVCR